MSYLLPNKKKYVSDMESKTKINTGISKHCSRRMRKKFVGRVGFVLSCSTVFACLIGLATLLFKHTFAWH